MNFHYTRTARSTQALTEDALARFAPSVFAVDKHESRSDKFIAVPTIDVVRELQRHDFLPIGAKQSKTRDPSRREYTKHLIRFRHASTITPSRATDGVPEIILKNANDGTSAYDLMAGVWREVCLNGLVVLQEGIESIKVRHNGSKVIDDVIEGTYRVLGQTESYMAAPKQWSALTVSREAAMHYAEQAHMLRFEPESNTTVQPIDLLRPRRIEDNKADLWSVFNVVQENIIKGGLSDTRVSLDSHGRSRVRYMRTRAVNGIDQDISLNRDLWQLTANMAGRISSQHLAA